MNFKKIITLIIASIMTFALPTAVGAKTYEYDLKTYDYVERCSTVDYVITYSPSTESTQYIVKQPNGEFTLSFVNSNVNDIIAIDITTQQISHTDGREGKKIENNIKYTKEQSLVPNGYILNENIFKGTYVSIPYNVSNGFYLGDTLETLGYSSAYQYGFSYIRVQLTCKVNAGNPWEKPYYNEDGIRVDNKPYGSVNDINFINEDGKALYSTRQSFLTSSNAKEVYKVYPFRTSLYPKSYLTESGYKLYENDVLRALKTPKYYGVYYFNPVAEINDTIAASEDVSFTFVSFVDSKNKELYNPYTYLNMELFNGGLVINNNLTLQLQDTNYFYWGDNKLTFRWSDITDGKVTSANSFLSSMLLYTSRDWYWDSLIVEGINSNDVVEDVSAGSGLEQDEDVIEEEEIIEEEPVDEIELIEDEAEFFEEEVAPVNAEPSPATGNSPVAMAVIPVALAAAAVVAKKIK